MELRHQRYFIAVAEELHFGRASKRLLISQPALSKQIRELEAEVGARLLWRNKREVRLTSAGASFLGHARDVLRQVDRSITEARSIGRGDLGLLDIGYLSGAGPRIVPRVVRAFRRKYPRVDVRVRMILPPQQLGEIRNRQVDFLFAGLPVHAPDLVIETLTEEPLLLAIPERHPLASRKRISFQDLDGVPIAIWPRHLSPESYDDIIRHFKAAGARMHTILETYPMTSLICAVASGLGLTFAPECARDNPQKGVVYRDLKAPCPTVQWGIAYASRILGEAQQAFLDVARDLYRKPSSSRH